MKPIEEFILDLHARGMKIWAEGDRLRYRIARQSLTPGIREELKERKTEILSFLKQTKQAAHSLPTIIPQPDQRYEPFPLTEIQQAYWLGRSDMFELGNVATHSYMEMECPGLDLERFNRSWQQLIDRHDMLRMIVLPTGQQQVLEQVPVYEVNVMDMRGKGPDLISAELEAVRSEMSHQVLPADQWPLFDIRATILDNGRTLLHTSFDALIADAWGMQIINRELLGLYNRPDYVLPPLELFFRDYILAEQEWQASQWYQRALQYWRDRLDTLPPAPDLPLAASPNSLEKPEFQRRSRQLDPDQWQKIKDRASRAGFTPSGVLLAAFAEILTAWSKEPRFTLNLTLFNRIPVHRQVYDIVGDFTSLILVEIDNTGPGAFLERAQAVQRQLWQDLDHRQVNGVRVLRELAGKQGNRQGAVMPVVFTSTLTLDYDQDDEIPSLGEMVYSISQTPQVWIDHQVSESPDGLLFNWDAIEELFPRGMLEDMFAAYCGLLEQLAISETSWVETSFGNLLPQWQAVQNQAVNSTAVPVSNEMLHTLFMKQVKQQGSKIAVYSSQRTLDYSQLYRLAIQVGRKLRQLGARPNTLIAIVMEKGWEQVTGVLGVLMSGAAYLPIDPAWPQERRQYLLEHGQVKLVLTQNRFDREPGWPEEVKRFCLDKTDEFSDMDDQPLDIIQQPEDLAYVIFTSGSTGEPKGVMIDHRGAVNTINDINRRFHVGDQDSVLALSALSFDLSVYDIFGLLAVGGTVVIPDAELAREPEHWFELLNQRQVTIWNTVPALMQLLVDFAEESRTQGRTIPDSLRLCLMSGDWIPVSLPDRVKTLRPGIEVISLGGATEASIWSICYPIETVEPSWTSIPYGKPMTNQVFHVYNRLMEPCPVWVPGQLYIGGTGLAKGYWRDEEKTNSSFIVHSHTNERLYKTGDLGRYLPSGDIEFLGREDFQVKIRGYRIELGEIEAALEQHESIKEAVVIAVGEREDRQLAAYIVTGVQQDQGEDYAPQDRETQQDTFPYDTIEIITDPVQREQFKFKQAGLRRSRPPAQKVLPLLRSVKSGTVPGPAQNHSEAQHLQEPPGETISFEDFSLFLSSLLQMKLEGAPLPKYRYASAGSLYPVQTYVSVKAGGIEGVESGNYYYHPKHHHLVMVQPGNPIKGESAFELFLIGKIDAITPLYGEWSRDFCLLEAGYIGQLLTGTAPAHQIHLCAVSVIEPEKYREIFKLEANQIFLHSFQAIEATARRAIKSFDQTFSKVWPPAGPPEAKLAPPEAKVGVIMDAVERMEFKLKQPGLRPAAPGQEIIPLAKPRFDEQLTCAYLERQSYRKFLQESITFADFSRLLSGLRGGTDKGSRLPRCQYPSLGDLYPVQTYITVKPGRIEGMEAGVYYYHPVDHSLELLYTGEGIGEEAYGEYGGFNRRIYEQSAFGLFLIGRMDAAAPICGAMSRDVCLVEAGYMSQLLMETAPGSEIGLCPIGNLDFDRDREHFRLDRCHVLLHSFLGGKISVEQTRQWEQASYQPVSLAETLRHFLETKLPVYMIPHTYIPLESLPLTANGKVDRKALPLPGSVSAAAEKPFVLPQTGKEQTIAAVWQEILEMERIGIHNNFFDLGGNSLTLIRVQTRLQDVFQQKIPLIELFEYPTVHALATHLNREPFEQKPGQENPGQAAGDRLDRRELKRQRRQIRQEHQTKN